MLRISQRHLKILETCPRQFEYTFCDRLTMPISLDRQSKTQLGSDFHLLMHQRELGLPIEPILARSPQLNTWMDAMLQAAPELFNPDTQAWRQSEHVRTLETDDYLFTAIYDLLILGADTAQIIDWKTYPLPRYKKDLDREWQTRLYLYILAETSNYVAKQMTFTYWFIQSNPIPKSVKIDYTLKQHRQTKLDLDELLAKLTNWLEAYHTKQEHFPQVSASTGLCQRCNFAIRCDRLQLDAAPKTTFDSRDLYHLPSIPI
ncbi:PD-(D/E)XK nuclease family protein [Chamaesiphon sp. VAR_48_metabat_403]|uniref:PD-(D/E)XK nuclease family protein n=1 Tax=Chamaesiphon sp. VAR_48_metabat_403 TaxID=2964700 RepID=UPI00286DF5F6|nr:PD-(D/E)XK nuclease family protein [Chamaesiphon sp. VAR_48_metabat_403]